MKNSFQRSAPSTAILNYCCYQMMSRVRKLVQRLVNDLFWSRLSKLITIPDCLRESEITRTMYISIYSTIRGNGNGKHSDFNIPRHLKLYPLKFMAMWLRGYVAEWLHGCVAAWPRGCVAAWLRGCLAAWLPCFCSWIYKNEVYLCVTP